MSRKWLLSLIGLALTASLLVPTTNAQFEIKVIESATTISFQQLAPTVSLNIDNGHDKPVSAIVRVELLKPSNDAIGTTESVVNLKRGRQSVQLALPLSSRELSPENDKEILWYRLHYIVIPQTLQAAPLEGFISLSEIAPELFELRISGPGVARDGMLYRARVRAVHPLTGHPAKEVIINASATLRDDTTQQSFVLSDTDKTDSQGEAHLDFQLPPGRLFESFQLGLEGTRNFITVKAKKEIKMIVPPHILVATDKSIYQPGQKIHARVLVLSASRRAVAAAKVNFTVRDPEDTVAHTAELVTSRFGITSAEWSIPEQTKLGDYQIQFKIDDDHSAYSTVKISRYDLPNFVVNVETDRPFYLKGQDALITVRGDYLFGEPVARGQVRVVRDSEEVWNNRKQKYETQEGEVFKGELGPQRIFTVRVPVAADFNELSESDYSRFKDLNFTAYVTDSSTNRTEQRRFDIRISKEPIHVYAIRPGDSYRESLHLPLTLYLSTFYADGTPARCNVVITATDPESDKDRILARVKTNQYGLAKLTESLPKDYLESSSLELKFAARDKSGNIGSEEKTFDYEDELGIRIETPRTVHSPGEPIAATIISNKPKLTLSLDIVRDWSVVESQLVQIRGGRASVLLPYKPEFQGELTLAAYAEGEHESGVTATRSILYPRRTELRLKISPTSPTYNPGDQARISFKSESSEGTSVESALGIAVVDRAVEERVRTDQTRRDRYPTFLNDVLRFNGYGETLGGINRKTLENIDTSKPVPADLDITAEILLNQYSGYFPYFESSDSYHRDARKLFASGIENQLERLRTILTNEYNNTLIYPNNESSLRAVLLRNGLDLDSLKDPWGIVYRPSFFIQQHTEVLVFKSAGPDKQFDTSDDFLPARLAWPYFRPTGEAIDKAVHSFHTQTGGYITDLTTLRAELLKQEVDLETLKDPWLKQYNYKFEINGTNRTINVTTSQPGNSQEFSVWQSHIDYFKETREAIDAALKNRARAAGFPENSDQLRGVLHPAGIDLDNLRDPWGSRYYVTFRTLSLYSDEIRMEARSDGSNPVKRSIQLKPTESFLTDITFRSAGADGNEGSPDDFSVATYRSSKSQQSPAARETPKVIAVHSGLTGAITGTVSDMQHAVLNGATVRAIRSGSDDEVSTTTDDSGRYLLQNLVPGIYEIRVGAPGFLELVVTDVHVKPSTVLELNLTLEVASAAETVTVTAGADMSLHATSASMSVVKKTSSPVKVPPAAKVQQPFSTPRLREFFPETLVWQPELITDTKGRAMLDFKLADNITTWKMSVIGSTANGQVGFAETEIRAFQPFFAELEPPQILTEGDQISLPVVVRNYLNKNQTVDLEMNRESWFSVNAPRKQLDVPARDSVTQAFDIQATSTIAKGKQRVTAIGSDFSDAIEKTVTVHPDGEEKAVTASDLLRDSTTLNFDLPEDMISNSAHVELKVYPNLMSHVWESVEGIMQRPYGCGEQTISSTYPSLLVLRYLKQNQQQAPIEAKAQRYLNLGYKQLLGYQSAEGGFTYWGRGSGDSALTAYALRFLKDAAEFTEVDQRIIDRARAWLLKQQRADGSWPAFSWNNVENERQTAILTALISRSLSQTSSCSASNSERTPLLKSLEYLERRSNEIDEPYLIASYSLAASSACEPVRAAAATKRLRDLGRRTSKGAYWALESNTPFYGWGIAGRAETTALAIQALMQTSERSDELIDQGLLFLLREKDRYGVWYSGQATINVLESLIAALRNSSVEQSINDNVDVLVNGESVNVIQLPNHQQMEGPIRVDLTPSIRVGTNRIELKRPSARGVASVQLVSTFWVPWKSKGSEESAPSATLQLEMSCDKTETRVMEPITCRVKSRRVDFRGYGMLLAEIGIPPGSDVDRSVLDSAIKSSNWAIDSYDVLPDRVIIYLWPRAGGTEFDIKFSPRMAMKAQSAASVLYDYYNPEARVTLPPQRFVIK